MRQVVIFHHPEPITDSPLSGSQVRPYQMMQAFSSLGYEVVSVTGYADKRKQAIASICAEINSRPQSFAFLYAESSTTPHLLTERNHIPISPSLDFGFFRFVREHGIPVGLFYRDVFWRFPLFKETVAWYKRLFMIPAYYYDIMQYRRVLNHLFLPSLTMAEMIPGSWPIEKMSALPPGCSISDASPYDDDYSAHRPLRLFYVGGVTPPVYDIRPVLEAMQDLTDVSLVICCRKEEWAAAKKAYHLSLGENIKIVHAQGDELNALYGRTDIALAVFAPHEYRRFAMPVKLFEALGRGLPVIASDGTSVSKFVADEDIGWCITSSTDLRALLQYLVVNRELVAAKHASISLVRTRHTWIARATSAANVLNRYRR